jgi:hypothetical protein
VRNSRDGKKLIEVAPVYTAELALGELRGFFVGMNGVMIALGYSFASYMGLSFIPNDNIMTNLYQVLRSSIPRTSPPNGEALLDLHLYGLS